MRLPEDGPEHGHGFRLVIFVMLMNKSRNYHITQQYENNKDYDFAYSFVRNVVSDIKGSTWTASICKQGANILTKEE
jgi:hypothetical protein